MPEHALRLFLREHLSLAPARRGLVVGLSGGLDSRVLLHALARLAPEFSLPLRAVHVHHGLSPHADAWAVRVAEFCAQDGVPLTVCRVQVTQAASLEGAARQARQAAFAAGLRTDEALLLAQHLDDQAETLLFRLLRGAGLTGLGAMRPATFLMLPEGGRAPVWRPFLGLSRSALAAYAVAQDLSWVEDESNADCRHDRNFLRHEILPRLASRWPAVQRTLADTALRLQEAEGLLQALAADMGAGCIDAQQRLMLPALAALSPPRQRLVLRHWLHQQGFPLPAAAVLEKILTEVVPARADAMPRQAWAGCEVRRYREHLYALAPLLPLPSSWECDWNGTAPLALPDGQWLWAEGEGAAPGWRVRYRQGGERLRRLPGGPSRELRTWLQEQGVPPWQRDRLPLLFRGEELVAVAGVEPAAADLPWHFHLGAGPGA